MTHQVFDLHRRGAARKCQQSIAGAVTSEINQHIDLVATNCLGEPGVTEAERAAPMVTKGTEAFGGGILGSNSRVEEQF